MEELYTIWHNGKKVANHLSQDEAQRKQRELENESWDAHIFVITDREDEKLNEVASSLIGKRFYYLNEYFGTVKSTPIITDVKRTNDDFLLHGRMYTDLISYYYVEKLLNGGFLFDGADSIQTLSIEVLKDYIKDKKEKWEGIEKQLTILEEVENSGLGEDTVDICSKNPHIGEKQTHKRG